MSKIINIIDNKKATEKKIMYIKTQDKLKTHSIMIARIPNISIIILNTDNFILKMKIVIVLHFQNCGLRCHGSLYKFTRGLWNILNVQWKHSNILYLSHILQTASSEQLPVMLDCSKFYLMTSNVCKSWIFSNDCDKEKVTSES